ncbi:MAG TPA: DnaA/Hda family protein [Terricaulis sp.]|nr:DnaA/Hda family protein [Terricaulis sp.]
MEHSEEARRDSAGMGAAWAYELARKELQRERGADFFGAYIENLTMVAEWNGALLFKASSRVAQERLRGEVQARLELLLHRYAPQIERIDILLEHEIPEDVRGLATARIEEARPVAAARYAPMRFDNFSTDSSNQRAFAVAEMIAAGQAPFPVWLVHSPPGRGKTHLLSAIHHAMTTRGGADVLMVTGQDFLEQFQSALQRREAASFKERVRAPDVLIIDDFHRLCGKKATEEEAFDTIHEITRRGGVVVLAANHGAEGLAGLDETLRAKLKGAGSTEILESNTLLRRRILDMRLAHHARVCPGFSVAYDALDMIAERINGSGRDLDGALCQLLIEWKVSGGTEVTLDAAAQALQNKFAESAERRVTVQLVQKVVARHYGMSVQQLLERTRRHSIARPRQVAMYLACRLTQASLPDIGARFGGFDHTTIMYARDRIAELVEKDQALNAEIEGVIRAIRREP